MPEQLQNMHIQNSRGPGLLFPYFKGAIKLSKKEPSKPELPLVWSFKPWLPIRTAYKSHKEKAE